jgi:acetyl esterase/lipase
MLLKIIPKQKVIDGVLIEERKLENAGIRIYKPEGKLSGAGLLFIHGGGFIIGTAAMMDRICAKWAQDLKLLVVSVGYHLAPKYLFPYALDDCFESWQWLLCEAQVLGIDTNRIAIVGQSAGGGLAASLAQRILDEGGIQPAAQALFYPMIDDRTAARRELDSIKHRVWNNKCNRAGWSAYLGQPPGEPKVPQYAVPSRRDNLAGLPPTWIGIGEIDLFYDECCQYSMRLNEAGVRCQLHVAPMAPHAFELFMPNASIASCEIDSYYCFIRESLSLSTNNDTTS